MSQYKVDSNIPLPTKATPTRGSNAKGYSKFPVRDMLIGDSFFAPGYTPRSISSGLYAATSKLAKELNGPKQRHYKQLDEEMRHGHGVKGTRVWRIE